MSRVYFHSEFGEAELSGRERAYMGQTIDALSWAFLSPLAHEWVSAPSPLRKLFPPNHYVQLSNDFERDVKLAFNSVLPSSMSLNGKSVDGFELALNTAILIGSDPIRLMARIHAQYELHAFVLPKNRVWLSNIIEQGREGAVFRIGMGWDSVLELLRDGGDGPIVLSSSVCDSFPHCPSEEEEEAWDDLTNAQRWKKGFADLRKHKDLEISPASLRQPFGDGMTVFGLIDAITK